MAHGNATNIDNGPYDEGAVPYQPSYPYGYGPGSTAGGVMAVGATSHDEADQVPLTKETTREIDDFSQGFNTALHDIQDDSRPSTNNNGMGAYAAGYRRGEGTALWQQNRKTTRNNMWI